MTDHSGKTFPVPTPETKPFWEGCHVHELRLQVCGDCDHIQFYPRLICTSCSGKNLDWMTASGVGEVISYTVITRPVSRGYADDVPYVVALVRLAEGPTMMSNITGCEPEQVKSGMKVEVYFEDWSEEISIPKFRPPD